MKKGNYNNVINNNCNEIYKKKEKAKKELIMNIYFYCIYVMLEKCFEHPV